MIIKTKGIIQVIITVSIVYLLIYFGIVKINLFSLKNLWLIKYIVLAVVLLAPIIIAKKFWKRLNKKRLIYVVLSSFLMLTFVSSIFVYKIEDHFFWIEKRDQATEFFSFSRFLLGLNYILTLPYIGVLISEIVFLIKSCSR